MKPNLKVREGVCFSDVTTRVVGLCVTWWREDPDADIKGKLDLLFTKRTKSAAEVR